MDDTSNTAEAFKEMIQKLQDLEEKDPAKYLEVLQKIISEVEEMKSILQ